MSVAEVTREPSMLDYATGLHAAVPASVYHRREPGIASKSVLDLVRRSPAHYAAWLHGVDVEEYTPALAFGAAFHCAVLEPEEFAKSYAMAPEFGDLRTKTGKSARDEWLSKNRGRIALSAEDSGAIDGMIASLGAHPLVAKMLRDGTPELTVRWRDADTGVECKSRADYYVRRLAMVLDLKTTQDASFDAFRTSVARYGYHRQDAMYRMGFAAAGAPIEHFILISVEKTPPHAVALYSLDADAISRGYMQTRLLLDHFGACVRDNAWPGYPANIQELDLPRWA